MVKSRVAVLMGSDSDWGTMQACVSQLEEFGLPCKVAIRSAHRAPKQVAEFAESARAEGIEVIIAAAGLSAALAGTVAAHTSLPVIGVPLASGTLQGIDALFSTVQMPPGIPVATMGIGAAGARNAAILAAQIIAGHDADVRAALDRFRKGLSDGVEAKDKALAERLGGKG